MAVEQMKRAHIIAHRSHQKKIVETLQMRKIIDLNDLQERVRHFHQEIKLAESEINSEKSYSYLAKVRAVLKFIDEYNLKKKGFIESMLPEKIDVTLDDYFNKINKFKIEEIYQQTEEIDISINETSRKIQDLRKDKKILNAWSKLDLPIAHLGQTKTVFIRAGEIEKKELESFQEELRAISNDFNLEIFDDDGRMVKIILIYHYSMKEEIEPMLAKFEWNDFPLVDYKLKAIEEIKKVEKKIEKLTQKNKDLLAKAANFIKYRPDLIIIQDYLASEIRKIEALRMFAQTKDSFMLEGWIREKDLSRLKKIINEITDEAEVTATEPSPGDQPPVSLDNPAWLRPFEFITEMFGPPNYREIDPTPVLAFFFIIFFGMCIGDVGYGLVLSLAAWYLSRKLKLGENGQKFMKLMIYGGFTSVVFGIITGSYFAFDSKYLPGALKSLSFFDFLYKSNSLIIYLVVALAFGVIQLWTGVFIEFVDNVRTGKPRDGIFDQIPILIMMPGLVLFIAYFLGKQAIPEKPLWATVGDYLFIIGTVLIILFHGRASRNVFARIGSGLYSFYNLLSGLISDIVSYARLMALGVATFLIGYAINLLITIMPDFPLLGLFFKIPGVGLLLTILIFIAGHLINLVINLISAFVHPVRLQYVEFFSKFYEDGGRKYQPLQLETKNLTIEG